MLTKKVGRLPEKRFHRLLTVIFAVDAFLQAFLQLYEEKLGHHKYYGSYFIINHNL